MSKDPKEIRRVRRIKTNMRARVLVDGAAVPVQVADISITGCRIVARGLPSLPATVSMLLEEANLTVKAEVVWQKGHSAGLRFLERKAAGGPDPASQIATSAETEAVAATQRVEI